MSRRSRDAIRFLDAGPDGEGRRHFALDWIDRGEWRPQLHPKDGKPCGYRRSQHFHSRPEYHGFDVKTGAAVPRLRRA